MTVGEGLVRISDVSGNTLQFDNSGRVAIAGINISGSSASVITAPTWIGITGDSGGTNLAAQACTLVRLVNLSGNGTMYVGGIGTAAPISGTKGLALWQPTANVPYLDFPITNANLISVVAAVSGNKLSYMTFT